MDVTQLHAISMQEILLIISSMLLHVRQEIFTHRIECLEFISVFIPLAVTSDTLTFFHVRTVFGVPNEYPLSPELSNGCNGLIGSSCPVTQGQMFTHGATIPLGTEIHSGIPVTLQFRMEHAPNEACGCVLVPIVVH